MHVSRFDVLVTVTNVSSTLWCVIVPVGWQKSSTPPCLRPPRIERGMEPTGGLEPLPFSLPKEVLVNHFLIGAPLRSNSEAIANNRCLAALPSEPDSPGPGTIAIGAGHVCAE
jgi:hypothetical protein